MFKKILSLCLALLMVAALCATLASCSEDMESDEAKITDSPLGEVELKKDFDVPEDFKIGFILLHDEQSTYDLNFINAVEKVKTVLGLTNEQVIYKKNVPESNACYEAACDLVDEGCDIIFADSFGHETHLLKAAEEHPDVEFCHATGTMAHTAGLDNFHNAFASIYEGRYLAGVAAGLKLNEMIANGDITAEEAKMGYVGAFTFAEVISGYTSFYLGAKSVCPSVTMEVQFTGSWYDENGEKNAATALINNGCVLISQHADSMGAPSVCEEKNVPNVSYNGSTAESCPNTFIVSSRIDWAPYYMYIIKSYCQGTEIATDWCGGAEQGSVVLTGINEKAAADGTYEKLVEVAAKLKSGEIKVFDTDTFTVGGEKLESYTADVNTDAAFTPDTEAIADGYFHESEYRAAPYFDVRIDGIKLLNENYG
ncbi:MAG: BMP family ABC transporter substrate-binding protein [Ruminococcaceae bacterium]|nr:BMP family ABC transporter substrate-binding protein [Oscillospiraceae bacterium]